jgi:hypothetical protein
MQLTPKVPDIIRGPGGDRPRVSSDRKRRLRTLKIRMAGSEPAGGLIVDVLALKTDPDWYVRYLESGSD